MFCLFYSFSYVLLRLKPRLAVPSSAPRPVQPRTQNTGSPSLAGIFHNSIENENCKLRKKYKTMSPEQETSTARRTKKERRIRSAPSLKLRLDSYRNQSCLPYRVISSVQIFKSFLSLAYRLSQTVLLSSLRIRTSSGSCNEPRRPGTPDQDLLSEPWNPERRLLCPQPSGPG